MEWLKLRRNGYDQEKLQMSIIVPMRSVFFFVMCDLYVCTCSLLTKGNESMAI